MTLRQWLMHLKYWLLDFPMPKEDEHIYADAFMGENVTCEICNKKVVFDPESEYHCVEGE